MYSLPGELQHLDEWGNVLSQGGAGMNEMKRRLTGSTTLFLVLVLVFFVGVFVGQVIMAGVLK